MTNHCSIKDCSIVQYCNVVVDVVSIFSLLVGCNDKTDRGWELISASDGEITIKYLLRTQQIKIKKQRRDSTSLSGLQLPQYVCITIIASYNFI